MVLAFLLLLSVFLITHALKFPGSVAYLMQVTHGQRMLDMQASFSSAETYQRLEAFGERGRSAYMRTILTVDLIFPVTAFLFLFLWARYACERAAIRLSISRAAWGLSIAYFILDLLENASILTMLSRYPQRLDFLGTSIGYLTRGKRISMMGALLLPAVLLTIVKASALLQARSSGGPDQER